MCIARIRQIQKVQGKIATTIDGQLVRIEPDMDIKIGEFAEVYADIVVRKVSKEEALTIQNIQKKGALV